MTTTQNRNSTSEVFAVVQQICSQINRDRMHEVIDRANGFNIDDKQLVVNLLGMALEKSQHILKDADRILLLLSNLALSASILACNRTIKSEHITSAEEQSPDVYRILGKPSSYVRVRKRGKRDVGGVFNERLVTWAHLSHTNVLPLFGAFLDGDDGSLSLVVPQITRGNIIEYTTGLSRALQILLITDVISGLCYLHRLNVIHGGLTPRSIYITDDGRACIADLDAYSTEESDLSSARYSAPEILKDEDPILTRAADVWSLGCLIYEVLSRKPPFHQQKKVVAAIITGKQPTRPGQDGSENDIDDTTWYPLSTCWEFQAEDRSTCLQFQKVFSSMIIHDDRPVLKVAMRPEAFQYPKDSAFNLEIVRSILTQILGSDVTMPPPSRIPEQLQGRLSGLVDNTAKAMSVALIASRLSPGDTQILLDVMDLLWEESPRPPVAGAPLERLFAKIMASTHMFPQRYKINHVRCESAPLAEAGFGKAYKGQDLEVCVTVITNPGDISDIVERLALWSRSSHPNILPLYGVFHEEVDEIPRLCLVSPYMKNGLMRDYAPRIPQKDRIPLVLDAINALIYLGSLNFVPRTNDWSGDSFLISDEGRAVLISFRATGILSASAHVDHTRPSEAYWIRFCAPERMIEADAYYSYPATVWSFGCLMFEVFSGRPPYYHYLDEEIRSVLLRREPLQRPTATEHGVDDITDQLWDLIAGCCADQPEDRLELPEIQRLLMKMVIQDNRPEILGLPGAEVLALRSRVDINWDSVKELLGQVQVELLRTPLSHLIQNHTRDVATAVVKFNVDKDVQVLVDFLDLALKDHITLSDERNRVLALLSGITTSTHVFPHRYRLNGIKCQSLPIAEGGFGAVYRGVSDENVCIKVMTRVDSEALMGFVKEVILWAHSSHPNILPFYGLFVDDLKRICLVSPFMTKGNLHNYAPQLSQKKRIPLLDDVIKGLIYLHGLGVVHTDLKGENVLISDEGHALITDFGASHVITATAKGGATAASVASTLRFTAPEIILNRHIRPTQECDIWSFGCLFYEVLSRKLPYFEYNLDAQIFAALSRGQLPKRPVSTNNDADDEQGWDEFEEPDWEEIDDVAWTVATSCWAFKPEDRPKALRVQELIVDMKIWDNRTQAKDAPGAHFLKMRSGVDVDLNRVGELLNGLQVQFLAQSAIQYPTGDVIAAVSKLQFDDKDSYTLMEFWNLVLQNQFFTRNENTKALALVSALASFFRRFPGLYFFSTAVTYNQALVGSGSFGRVHQGSNLDLCVKITNFAELDSNLTNQWVKALPSSAFASHPNILPFYGLFNVGAVWSFVCPFMSNGNLCDHIPRLLQTARIPLISDVIEALIYLHGLGIIHSNLKGENILISNEGRALVTDFRPYHVSVAAGWDGPTVSYVTSTLRFTAPELINDGEMLPTVESDVWSVGCLIYLVLSQNVPFHHYSEAAEIRSIISQGELPARPVSAGSKTDTIDDPFWGLIVKCCARESTNRPTLHDIRKFLMNLGVCDHRPPPKPLPGADILNLRIPHPGVDIEKMENLWSQIQAQLPPAAQDCERGDKVLD